MTLLQSPRQATLGSSLDLLQLQTRSQVESRKGGWHSLAKQHWPRVSPVGILLCHQASSDLPRHGRCAFPRKEGDVLFGTAKEETIGQMRRPEVPEQKNQFKIHLEWELPRPSLQLCQKPPCQRGKQISCLQLCESSGA